MRNNELLHSLLYLGGELDRKGIGLSSEQATNLDYKALSESLERLRPKVVSREMNEAISTYLSYSYALNSLLLFLIYVGFYKDNLARWLPARFRTSGSQMTEAIQIHMYRLLTEVAKSTETMVLGEEAR